MLHLACFTGDGKRHTYFRSSLHPCRKANECEIGSSFAETTLIDIYPALSFGVLSVVLKRLPASGTDQRYLVVKCTAAFSTRWGALGGVLC